MMVNVAGELPMDVIVDGRERPSDSRYAWTGGGLVLTISTVLPESGLAFELISTYVGHRDTDTIATHLTLCESRQTPCRMRNGLGSASNGRTRPRPRARTASREINTSRHPHEQLNPVGLARACAYDHAGRLIEALANSGHVARVAVGEQTFAELERVE